MRLHILGSLNFDVMQEVAALPLPGETVLAARTSHCAGGKGANQARAAARFGARTHLHGAVGDDEAGRSLVAGLAADGVDVSSVVMKKDAATGRAHVTVSADGENMIVVDLGANGLAQFQPPPTPERTIFLTQLETPVQAADAMFRTAHPGDLCVLNTAPATAEGRRLFPLCDLIVLNEVELAVYAGATATSAVEIAGLARQLIERAGQHFVVTRGAAGAMIVSRDVVDHTPAPKVKVVDTTGAGDCFVGVLTAVLAEGAALKAATEVACLAAALSVQTLGADSAPTRAVIAAHLRSLRIPLAAPSSIWSSPALP